MTEKLAEESAALKTKNQEIEKLREQVKLLESNNDSQFVNSLTAEMNKSNDLLKETRFRRQRPRRGHHLAHPLKSDRLALLRRRMHLRDPLRRRRSQRIRRISQKAGDSRNLRLDWLFE